MRLLKTITSYATGDLSGSLDNTEIGDRIAMDITEGTVNTVVLIANTTTNIAGGTKSNVEAYGCSDATSTLRTGNVLYLTDGIATGVAGNQPLDAPAINGPALMYVRRASDSARAFDDLTCPYVTFMYDEDRTSGVVSFSILLYGTPRQFGDMKTETSA